jgi:hypothetical protein
VAERCASGEDRASVHRGFEGIRKGGFSGGELEKPNGNFIPEAARKLVIDTEADDRPGGVVRKDGPGIFPEKIMLRLLDHRKQAGKMGYAGRVGVGELHAASVLVGGGACHGRGDRFL